MSHKFHRSTFYCDLSHIILLSIHSPFKSSMLYFSGMIILNTSKVFHWPYLVTVVEVVDVVVGDILFRSASSCCCNRIAAWLLMALLLLLVDDDDDDVVVVTTVGECCWLVVELLLPPPNRSCSNLCSYSWCFLQTWISIVRVKIKYVQTKLHEN